MTFSTSARVLLSLLFVFFLPSPAFAATLSISPSSVSVAVGQAVTVSVVVSSPQAINAIASTLTFPADLLRVASISKSGSILSLWIEDPVFSNTAGTVDFSGAVPNPGFTGNGARVVSINFVAKTTGTATLSLQPSSSVLANDGNGTNVFTSADRGTISIEAAPEVQVQSSPVRPPSPEEATITCSLPAPIVISIEASCAYGPWVADCTSFAISTFALLIILFLLGMYLWPHIMLFVQGVRASLGKPPTRVSHNSWVRWTSPVGLGFFMVCVGLFLVLLHFAGLLG